jgi:acetyl-CoA acetyltransferase
MPEVREAVIVEAVRTPIGKRNGSLKDTHPVDLLAEALKEVVGRAGVLDQIEIDLWPKEKMALMNSGNVLRETIGKVLE